MRRKGKLRQSKVSICGKTQASRRSQQLDPTVNPSTAVVQRLDVDADAVAALPAELQTVVEVVVLYQAREKLVLNLPLVHERRDVTPCLLPAS